MLHFPNAKINIGLSVTEKRADGYHNIETVFYPLPQLKDALEVLPIDDETELTIRFSGKKIDGDSRSNLVVKAFYLLQNDFPEKLKNIQIHLLKSIPMGAGLGGGSADGAFMLRLLNKFFELNLSDTVLAQYALQLGSDCPFFIYNTPHFAKGRGEILSPIELDLSQYSIQLICPNLHVSTALAFSKMKPRPAIIDLSTIGDLPIMEWRNQVVNDFEEIVFEEHPMLAAIKQKLYDEGALYAAMSGSGSSLFGIFKKGFLPNITSWKELETFYFE